ncbi:MAG: dipeptide epimerase [Pseudomonadota bacterium]
MIITDIEIIPYNFRLKEPYEIAYEKIESTDNIFLLLKTNKNITGYGCAAPDLAITKETKETVVNFLNGKARDFLKNKDPLRYAFLMDSLKNMDKNNSSALASVDMALLDILGKISNLPLFKLFGAYRTSFPTSVTIGIMNIPDTLKKATGFIKDGFKIIKLKGGKNIEEDIEKIIKIRELAKDKIAIRFDANQGYSLEDVKTFFNKTKNAKVQLIEQPSPKHNDYQLGESTRSVDIPIMADESLMSLKDAFRLARKDIVDMINIKLMKVGGIIEAVNINAVAKSAGLEAMIGCMDESCLSISAALHFALSRPNVIYADLDGHLDLLKDPFANSIILKHGILYPTDKPGLGLNISDF